MLPDDARLRVMALPHGGLAAARNAGIAAARGAQLLFVDDDIVPGSDDTLARWARAAQAARGAWMPRFSVSEAFAATAVQVLWRERLERGGRRRDGADLGPTGFWFAALWIERSLLGGERFHSSFRGYGWEEVEFGVRLHRRGVRARLAQDVLVHHDDTIRFADLLRKHEEMGRNSWTFRAAAPGLRSALLTGTLAPVLSARRLLRVEARGQRVAEAMRGWADEPPRPDFKLDLRPLSLALEGAYTRGVERGRRERRMGRDS